MYLAGKNTRGMGKKWAAGSDEAVTDAGHQGDWGWRIWAHKGNNRVIDSYERRPVNPVGGGQMHERCLVDITNTRLFPVGRIGLAQQQATTTLLCGPASCSANPEQRRAQGLLPNQLEGDRWCFAGGFRGPRASRSSSVLFHTLPINPSSGKRVMHRPRKSPLRTISSHQPRGLEKNEDRVDWERHAGSTCPCKLSYKALGLPHHPPHASRRGSGQRQYRTMVAASSSA